MYVVILAGGGGTRLWPLSRRARPKPFVPLTGPESLFRRTVSRVLPLVGPEGVYVIAERRHVPLVREQAPDLPEDHVLAEPEGRNTAPAIALATLAIDRPLGESMIVLPADHWIADEPAFRDVLARAAGAGGLAEGALGVEGPLLTLGVRPDRPETGYGYLMPGETAGEVAGLRGWRLRSFVEKPDAGRAVELVRRPDAAWNAGIFAWRRRAILSALERFAPDVLDGVRLALLAPHATDEGGLLDGPEAARRYASVRSVSIDYAVMEPAADAGMVLMASIDVGWSDVGSWAAVAGLLRDTAGKAGIEDVAGGSGVATEPAADGAGADGARLDLGSRDTFVWRAGGRLVVTVGLSDTIVVDTPDALLVCATDRAQDVRAIVDRLRDTGETDHL